MMGRETRAVLFDLDGTLIDSAPDLGAAADKMRTDRGLDSYPLERYRPMAGAGARGMLGVAFGITPESPEFAALREEFFVAYERRMLLNTQVFDGIQALIEALRERGLLWGVVTNKSTRFTEQILSHLNLKPDCVACGDTTPHLKPHPASLLHAAGQLKLAPLSCWYLGDDLRDMKAARAAGMKPVAVEWGYHHPDNGGPGTWEADFVIDRPLDLLRHL